MKDDKKAKPPAEKHDEQKDYIEYIERKEYRDINREVIIEKMQRPEPWPDPPDETDNKSSK